MISVQSFDSLLIINHKNLPKKLFGQYLFTLFQAVDRILVKFNNAFFFVREEWLSFHFWHFLFLTAALKFNGVSILKLSRTYSLPKLSWQKEVK